MKKYLALLACITFSGYIVAEPTFQTHQVGSSLAASPENIAPDFHNMPKDNGRMALSYVNQPPMIPHSIKGYQITKNTNQCLSCHGIENYRATEAPRISPTHFTDRDGNIGSVPSPNRHFCLSCHVEQADVAPIIENKFKPTTGYGG